MLIYFDSLCGIVVICDIKEMYNFLKIGLRVVVYFVKDILDDNGRIWF